MYKDTYDLTLDWRPADPDPLNPAYEVLTATAKSGHTAKIYYYKSSPTSRVVSQISRCGSTSTRRWKGRHPEFLNHCQHWVETNIDKV